MTETFTAKINEIKADVKGTLHTLEVLKNDRSPVNSWTDDYMKVVMENQLWLIEKVESLRAKHVEKLVKENKELEATLKKLDDEYQKDIANAEGAKRSYKKQRDFARDALKFYAKEENWIGVITSIGNFPGLIEKDQGEKAREVVGRK